MSDGRNYGFEFNWLDVSLVLRGESRPLPDFVPILIKSGVKTRTMPGGNSVPRRRKVFCTASAKFSPSKAKVRARTCRS